MRVDRKTLYKEIWKEPMAKVSQRYGVSYPYLKKICIKYKIPTPSADYWVKIRNGQKVSIPKLPNFTQSEVILYTPRIREIEFQRESAIRSMEYQDKNDFDILKQEVADWELAAKIRDYVAAVESKVIHSNKPKHEKQRILSKVRWAREKADWIDPFLGEKHKKRLFFDY